MHLQASFKKKLIAFKLTAPLILIMAGILFSSVSNAQNKGKEIFEKNCAVCHKISEEKLVGPGLKGVTERREKKWLKKFIPGSQGLVKAGDPIAVKVFNENGKIPMPDHKFLTDDDLNQLLTYIETYKPAEARKVTVDITKKDGFSRDDMLRGERLFSGVLPFEKGTTINCVSCHAIIATDSLNFNPSAADLAKAWKEPNGTNLYQVLNEPTSAKMTEVHKGLQLSDKEIYDISAFLSDVGKKGMTWEGTFPARLLLFLFLGLLMALALADLIWFKRVKYRVIHVLVIIVGLGVHGTLVIQEAINLGRTKDYMPDQPIKFSHKVHAGQNQIDCKYCHSIATYSKSAGIPSANLCMNCHKVVIAGSRSGKFEIRKIQRAIESGTPIQWIRIHKLPDHVFFSHAQHVGAGKVQCQTCHGAVEKMDLVKQVSDLSMGWCVNCHRQTGIQATTNKYYESFKALHDEAKAGKKITAERLGGIDCAKCHY
jgi:mono/diheme cytochrome c family protein